MFVATIRGMLAHRLRLALTTASITLGVAFLAGTLILTDTVHKAFDQLYGKVAAGTDAVVRQQAAYTPGSDSTGARNKPISATTLDTVRHTSGVRAADGVLGGYALLTDTAGKAIVPGIGAGSYGSNWVTDDVLRGDVKLSSGRAPHGANEVVIDAGSATSHHIARGSQIKILTHGPTQAFTVVGTVTFGGEKTLGGGTSAYFDTAVAQQLVGQPGQFDQIIVSAKPGVTQAQVADQLNKVLPTGAEAITGNALAKEFSDSIKSSLGFVTIMFSVFAGIALFVGSFIIWNTFTMIVTQRSREIALLRAVGASRGQVMRSLVTESVLLGLSASAIGIGVGIGVAKGLSALMSLVGFSLPTTSMQLAPRTIWVSMLVGTIVTVVAALAPARRATKVLPVEALREAVPGTGGASRRRAVIGAIVTGGGLAALGSGLFGDGGIQLFGLGIVGTVLGVTTLGPLAARPLAAAIGAPLKGLGLPGELARQNAMRNPRRTSSTAAALMIGLALVVSVSVFASSLKQAFGNMLGDSTKADLFVATSSMSGTGFSTDVVKEVAKVPGVQTASPTGWAGARFDGSEEGYASVDPATVEKVLDLQLSAGTARNLGTDGVVVARKVADSHHWSVGSVVPTEFASTGKVNLKVVGIFDREGGFIDSSYILSTATQQAHDGTRLDSTVLVVIEKGADKAAVKQRIATVLVDHPDARVLTQKEYQHVASGFVDKLLIFVTVMLLLAVIIALLGIVNTLALSVFERTRELGLLRAVGMTTGQVRSMVRWESVVISLIGATAGAGLGLGLGMALVRAMHDQGIKVTVVPGLQIAAYVALAAIAGVVAAIGPARSAAKVDVLKAVVTD